MSKIPTEKFLRAGILEKWHNKRWEDFTNSPQALSDVAKVLGRIEETRSDGVGIWLYGANGTGKSLLLNLSFMQLVQKGYRCKIVTMSTLINIFAQSWYDDETKRAFEHDFKLADFLGIEEVGKTFGNKELSDSVFDGLLKYRIQRTMPVWVTSNIPPDKIKDASTEDIASMLSEVMLPVKVTGSDMRGDIHRQIIKKYL